MLRFRLTWPSAGSMKKLLYLKLTAKFNLHHLKQFKVRITIAVFFYFRTRHCSKSSTFIAANMFWWWTRNSACWAKHQSYMCRYINSVSPFESIAIWGGKKKLAECAPKFGMKNVYLLKDIFCALLVTFFLCVIMRKLARASGIAAL